MHVLLALALTLTDLQGYWVTARYADALEKTRSPMRAEQVAPLLQFQLFGNRAEIANFHAKGWSWWIVPAGDHILAVTPLTDPKRKPRRLPLKLTRGPNGGIATIHVELWPKRPATFRPIDVDVNTFARRVVVAGTYRDANGVKWVFDEHGNRSVGGQWEADYIVGLDLRDACCDYLAFGEEWVGFRWQGGKLLLYKILEVSDDCRISCAKTPYAVLTPVQ